MVFLGCAIFCLFGGGRPAEAQKLTWEYVHINDGLIEVPKWVSKIHRAREVTDHPTMAVWLALCPHESGPIVDMSSYQKRFEPWRKAAKITRWPHDALRRTFAGHHVSAFKNPAETAR